MNNILMKFGRIMFALPFAVFGLMHFINNKQMAEAVLPGWPGANFLVYISGAGLFLASVSFIVLRYEKIASLLLAAELFIFIVTIHLPGLILGDEQMLPMFMTNLLKDMSLMGGALLLFTTFTEFEEKKEQKRTVSESWKEKKVKQKEVVKEEEMALH